MIKCFTAYIAVNRSGFTSDSEAPKIPTLWCHDRSVKTTKCVKKAMEKFLITKGIASKRALSCCSEVTVIYEYSPVANSRNVCEATTPPNSISPGGKGELVKEEASIATVTL